MASARVFGALEGQADDSAAIDMLFDTLELQYSILHALVCHIGFPRERAHVARYRSPLR